jgi:hypothetical protein
MRFEQGTDRGGVGHVGAFNRRLHG